MAKGSKIGHKRKTRNKVRLEKRGSDESDEDYNIDEDEEFNESEDDYCSSLAEDESEESLGGFEDEEEEWVQKKVKNKKAEKPSGRGGVQTRKKNAVVKPKRKNVVHSEEGEDTDNYYSSSGAKRRKRSRVSDKEEENDDTGTMCDEDGFVDVKPRKKSGVSKSEIIEDCYSEDLEDKDKVSYIEEKEEDKEDDDESDDSDDEEFTPGEAFNITRRNPVKKWGFRRKNRSSNPKDSRAINPAKRKKKTIKEWGWGRRKKTTMVSSDSDFVSSASSDYEYTVSEEEREQVKEATALCRRLTSNLRGSTSLKTIKKEESVPPKRKRPVRKGKRKVVDLNIEIGRQVCGICLSEEGKRTVRGVLNCCSHYFCFACIMEWSKVESRCPLCKQRFTTISRTARAEGGHDLRDAVFPVPERDQVYQPSEEELRGYLDPYENFHCTECHQGGDDALMLLCDLCDSPAHTYCVGLGREVPDGNWYCDGCRPTALASSNAQGLNPENGSSNNLSVGSSPIPNVRETFDLNEAYVPETPLTQVSQSPRHSVGLFQPTSPSGSGSGAFTLHDRRRIQRQIHNLLNNRSRQAERSDGVASSSSINLFGSPIGRGVVQNPIMPSRMGPTNIYLQGRLAEYNNTSLLYNREARLSSMREETVHNQASSSNGHNFGGLSQSEFSGRMGGGLGQQLHPCSATSNTGADANTSPFQFPEATGVHSRTLQGSMHRPF